MFNSKPRAMENNPAAIIAAKALPALSGSSLTYNAEKNVFLTQAYTSLADNTYYKAIRVSDRLAVAYNIGEGYKYTFLNGITLFAWDGRKARIVAQKFWGGSNWRIFTEQSAMAESIIMLKDFLATQAKLMGRLVGDRQLMEFSRAMISETQRKMLR